MALPSLRLPAVSRQTFRTAFRVQGSHFTRRYLSLDSYIVSPKQVADALSKNAPTKLSTAPRVIPLCVAWFMPNDPERRTGLEVFRKKRIPTARFFDIDKIKDDASPYPHMLPTPEMFAKEMGKLGIRRDDSVVVYDTAELGIFSAPRVAWTLKVFGHNTVHILNNFKLWVEQSMPTESGDLEPVDAVEYHVPKIDKSRVITFEDLRERILEQGKEGAEPITVLDARSPGRFDGSAPEPREGLSSGHMPHSFNIPFTDVLNSRTKAFLPPEELKLYFETRDIKLDAKSPSPIISSCGTGVTACVVDAALTQAGFPEKGRRIYDGSWTEWAQRAQPQDNLIQES